MEPATNFFLCTDQTLEYVSDPSKLGPVPGSTDDGMYLCTSSHGKTLLVVANAFLGQIGPQSGLTPS